MLGSKTKNVCCTSLSLIRVLEIGVFLFDEAEELDSFYIKCIVKLKKLEVLSLFNFQKSDDLDFNCLNGLTNLRLVNHWQCHPELVQLLHSQVNATIISQSECLLQNIYELNI